MSAAETSRAKSVTVAVVGVIVVAAYATLAGMQILALNPLAASPGSTLREVHRDMAAANESLNVPFVLGLLAVGVLLAIAALIAVVLRAIGTVTTALVLLVLLALGAPAYFIASFGPGMALADTYGISGADQSPWAIPLYWVSALAIPAAIVAGIRLAGNRDRDHRSNRRSNGNRAVRLRG